MGGEPILYRDLERLIGEEIGISSWLSVEQDLIDAYAGLTGDHGFVHVDREAAAASPFGTTIAHGLLTLSLASNIGTMVKEALPSISDRVLLLNYGYDRVRFVAPVTSGTKIRGRFRLAGAEARAGKERLLRYTITVERQGHERPAMVADWLLLVVLA